MANLAELTKFLQADTIAQIKEVKKNVENFTKSFKDAQKQIITFSEETQICIELSNKALKKSFKMIKKSFSSISNVVETSINKTIEYSSNVDKMSKTIGISKKGYQEWEYIINRCGGNVKDLQNNMKFLGNQTLNANSDNKAAIANFNKLGISIKDTNGNLKSQEVLFEEVVSKMQKYPEGAEKAKLANDLFGDSSLMPICNENAASISDLKAEMEKLGIVMSDEQIEAANNCSQNFKVIKQAFDAITMSLGNAFIPIVSEVTAVFINNFPQIRGIVMPIIEGIANVIKWVCDNINIAIPLLSGLIAAFTAFSIINNITATILALRDAISAVELVQSLWNTTMAANPIGLIVIGVGALIGVIALLVANWDTVKNAVTNFVNTAVAKIQSLWQKIQPIFEKIKKAAEFAFALSPLGIIVNAGKMIVKNANNESEKIDGSLDGGLANVPFDGYIAKLHKGERVLTASENRNYNTTNNNQNSNRTVTVNFYGDVIGNNEFLNNIKQKLGAELQKALMV